MTVWPRSVVGKLVFVAACAAIAIGGLEVWFRQHEAEARTRSELREAAAADLGLENVASPVRDRGFAVHSIVLCDRPGTVPEAAVEWRLLSDGSLVQRRSPPLPTVPGRMELQAAAVVLPALELGALDPELRVVLLDLLSSIWIDRPVAVDRLILQGIVGDAADRAALVSWLR